MKKKGWITPGFGENYIRFMNVEDFTEIRNSLPGVTTDIKWEHDLCFSVGKKLFFVVGLDQILTTASFKVSDEDFEELTQRPGFKPAPYMAKHKWIFIEDINLVTKKEWFSFITQSYKIIFRKLPKKIQNQLKG